jgi:hypothetical protein
MKRMTITALGLCLTAASVARAGLQALPAEVSLNGPAATQRIVVVTETGGKVVR